MSWCCKSNCTHQIITHKHNNSYIIIYYHLISWFTLIHLLVWHFWSHSKRNTRTHYTKARHLCEFNFLNCVRKNNTLIYEPVSQCKAVVQFLGQRTITTHLCSHFRQTSWTPIQSLEERLRDRLDLPYIVVSVKLFISPSHWVLAHCFSTKHTRDLMAFNDFYCLRLWYLSQHK